jgi:transposase
MILGALTLYTEVTRELLTDSQWKRIEEMVRGKASDSGVTAVNNRRFVEAVLWIARTGAPWRDLPAEFGNWHSTYTRFSRWCKRGVWTRLMATLGRDSDLEALTIDSTVVRAHQHTAGAQKKRGIKHWGARVEG